uniref:Uncharacterized protein n=1 Tax=Oryza meridionalis TaxID=40149 RepID=A0A0E0D5J0_9ORYZ
METEWMGNDRMRRGQPGKGPDLSFTAAAKPTARLPTAELAAASPGSLPAAESARVGPPGRVAGRAAVAVRRDASRTGHRRVAWGGSGHVARGGGGCRRRARSGAVAIRRVELVWLSPVGPGGRKALAAAMLDRSTAYLACHIISPSLIRNSHISSKAIG